MSARRSDRSSASCPACCCGCWARLRRRRSRRCSRRASACSCRRLSGRARETAILVAVFGFWSLVNLRGVALAVRLNSIATVAKLLPLLMVAIGGAFFVDSREPADRRDASRRRCRAHVAAVDLRVCGDRVRAGAERRSARHGAHGAARDRAGHDRDHALYIALQVVAQGILGSALATADRVTACRCGRRVARRMGAFAPA